MRDEEIAMALQAAELHRQHVHDQRRLRQVQVVAQDSYQMTDPLWGEIVSNEPPSFGKRFLFSCCPCCVVGCSSKEAVRSWRNFLVSFSTLFAVVQVAALLFTIVLSGSFVSPEKNPMLGPHYHVLDTVGAKNAAKILLRGEWWRIFTAEMLHAGLIHLAGNLCVQLRTGCALEVLWGHWFWLVIYISSGTYATLASCAFHPDRIGVGSSGALCGLIGAWLAFIVITWNQTLPADVSSRNTQAVSITGSIIIIVASSFLPLMDMAAHAGGLAMGASIAMVVFGTRLQSLPHRLSTLCMGVILVVALITCTTYIFVTHSDPNVLLLNLCQPPAC